MQNDASGTQVSSREQILIQNAMESCPAKSGLATVAGFAMGGLFGMFMSGLDTGNAANLEKYNSMTTREQIRYTVKDMGTRSYSSAKNFALVGALFAANECIIETYRAKNDIWNGVSAGCVTGGILAAKAGPKAMVFGCAGFAAFSAAIDVYIRSS